MNNDKPATQTLSPEQQDAIKHSTYRLLEAAVLGQPVELTEPEKMNIPDAALFGVFVSLKREGRLRSCMGATGKTTLWQALCQASHSAATSDPRFDPVAPEELPGLEIEVWLLYNPQEVPLQGEARVSAVTVGRHGVIIGRGQRRGLLLPGVATDLGWNARQFLEGVCRKAQLPPDAWLAADTTLWIFEGVALSVHEPRAATRTPALNAPGEDRTTNAGATASTHLSSPQAQQTAPSVRQAAKAGLFYPANPQELRATVRSCLSFPRKLEKWPAIMTPHAGLKFSGRIAGETFCRVQLPKTIIVLAPNHTGLGAPWAVMPYEAWAFPGGRLSANTCIAQELTRAVEGLRPDALAHQNEHSIEVQAPLIHMLSPRSEMVGITITSGCSYEDLQRFAQCLAAFMRTQPEPPLLVISTDLNHFAAEPENRRLDMTAIEAMQSLNSKRLFETCHRNRISMCGMQAAVVVLETLKELGRLSRSELVNYTNSASVTGDKSRVVGYAGMLLG